MAKSDPALIPTFGDMNGKTVEGKFGNCTVAHGAVDDEKTVTVTAQEQNRVGIAHVTPEQARELAAELLALADFVEGKPAPKAGGAPSRRPPPLPPKATKDELKTDDLPVDAPSK